MVTPMSGPWNLGWLLLASVLLYSAAPFIKLHWLQVVANFGSSTTTAWYSKEEVGWCARATSARSGSRPESRTLCTIMIIAGLVAMRLAAGVTC